MMLKGASIFGDISSRLLFWSFCCFFFFIPFATSPAVISGAIALAIWIFSGKVFRDRDKWLKQEWTFPVLVFILLPWLGLLWTNDIAGGLDFAKKSYYWLYAFAIASMNLSRKHIIILLNAFLSGLLLISIISLLQFTGVVPLLKWLPTIFSGKSITASLLLVFGMLILSFYFSKAENIKSKILISSLILLFFIALSVGTGRAGYLAFILLGPVVMYNIFGKKIIKVIAGTAIIISVLFLSPSVQERTNLVVSDISNYQQEPNTSVGLRLHMWQGAIKIFLENPVIGVGTGGYQSAMKKYETPNLAPINRDFSDPHNSYLYMAANFGILGIISLFWLFGILLKNGWRNRHNITGFAILLYTLVLIIGSLTATQILSFATAVLFAVFTGLQKHINGKD